MFPIYGAHDCHDHAICCQMLPDLGGEVNHRDKMSYLTPRDEMRIFSDQALIVDVLA
jgi:hypothetical protein